MMSVNVGSSLTFSNPPPIKSKHPKVWDTDFPGRGRTSWQHHQQPRAGATASEEAGSASHSEWERMTPV